MREYSAVIPRPLLSSFLPLLPPRSPTSFLSGFRTTSIVSFESTMSTRIPRLWQPGNPQTRVFLPDFWMRFVETPNVGRQRLPPHAAKFEVHPQMSRMDVRQYLEKIYKLPVRDVRIENRMGEIEWSNRHSRRYRQALWKEDDQKYAYVFFKLGSDARIRFFDLSQDEYSEMDKQMNATARYIKDQTDAVDRVNEKRAGVGQLLP